MISARATTLRAFTELDGNTYIQIWRPLKRINGDE